MVGRSSVIELLCRLRLELLLRESCLLLAAALEVAKSVTEMLASLSPNVSSLREEVVNISFDSLEGGSGAEDLGW